MYALSVPWSDFSSALAPSGVVLVSVAFVRLTFFLFLRDIKFRVFDIILQVDFCFGDSKSGVFAIIRSRQEKRTLPPRFLLVPPLLILDLQAKRVPNAEQHQAPSQ